MIWSGRVLGVTRACAVCCALLVLAAISTAPFAQTRGAARDTPSSACQGGYVHQASGMASIQRGSAKVAPAKVGDTFEKNTTFRTGPDERAVLKFADGQIVALGPNSALRIGRYCYVANDIGRSGTNMELINGQMRVVAGLMGASYPASVHIIAAESMVRIVATGGADFTVSVNPDPQDTGYAVVARGAVSVQTPYGPITTIADNQYALWRPGRAPLPLPIAAAPAVIQAATAGLWATVLPSDRPVEVASAARTAVAVAELGPALAAVGTEPKPIGYVEQLLNAASIQTTSSGKVTAGAGKTFGAGSTFNTGADGRVVLKFADGQFVILGPGSTLNVTQYQFDPSNLKSSNASLELENGAMRVVTGVINEANPAGLSISAGASIIDVLGNVATDFTVAVDARQQDVGVARVTAGEISVQTPNGALDKIQANKSGVWGPRTTAETPLPAAMLRLEKAAEALQLSGLPDNTPVAIEPAARAAAQLAQAEQAQAAANANPQNTRLQEAAQAAAEMAKLATQAADTASEAVAARLIAAKLDTLSPTAAGPALAQAPVAAPAFATVLPPAPMIPGTTPGATGGCTGSPC